MLYCLHSVIPSDSTYLFVDVKQAAWFLNYQHIEVYTPRKYYLSTHRLEDIKDSSWLRVQDREIFSERGLKHRATKERGFQEHVRKIFPDLARGRHDESYIFLCRV